MVNFCPCPNGASLKTGFLTPFLPSYTLRICDRVSRAGTTRLPLASLSEKISRFFARVFSGGNRFPIALSSGDLD